MTGLSCHSRHHDVAARVVHSSLSAVTIAAAPNIAVGDALVAGIFNLVILVVFDVLSREAPPFRRIDQGHILSAGFGVILIGFVGAVVLLSRNSQDLRIFYISG